MYSYVDLTATVRNCRFPMTRHISYIGLSWLGSLITLLRLQLMVCLLYGQLADKPTRRQPTRRQTNSPTHQLADRQTRRQSNSPTNQLADNKLADRPTRRQLNWPQKTNLPKLKLSPKSMYDFLDTWTCLSGKIAKEKLATRCRCDCCQQRRL